MLTKAGLACTSTMSSKDLKQLEQRLVYLNALENSNKKSITELGKTMSIFPLVPRLAKMYVSLIKIGPFFPFSLFGFLSFTMPKLPF
jgi:hypothetical protein